MPRACPVVPNVSYYHIRSNALTMPLPRGVENHVAVLIRKRSPREDSTGPARGISNAMEAAV
jgi:hypothetical protein